MDPINLLITLLILGLILGAVVYIAQHWLPAPFSMIVQIVAAIIAIVYLLQMLRPLADV